MDCSVSGADRKNLPRLWLNYSMGAWKAVWLDSTSVGPLGPTTHPCLAPYLGRVVDPCVHARRVVEFICQEQHRELLLRRESVGRLERPEDRLLVSCSRMISSRVEAIF